MFKKVCSVLLLSALLTFSVPFSPGGAAASADSAAMPAAGNATLTVIDVSHYNVPVASNGDADFSQINWSTVARNVDAMYIKATDGRYSTYTDPYYQQYAAAAQAAHISYGFYHYFYGYANLAYAVAEADNYYGAIKNIGFDCTPALDVEEFTDGETGAALSKAQMTASILAFAGEFKRLSGLDLMIYTSNSFINNYFDPSLSRYKLWVANYNGTTVDTNVWHSWDMWQYASDHTVPGLPGEVDANKATSNIFLGSVSGLAHVDRPAGTLPASDITVSGWTVSHYGTARVDVYVDGKSVAYQWKSDFSQRADIENLYGGSGYDDALDSGFNVVIPDVSLRGGKHTLQVAAINSRGNAVWSAPVTFTTVVPAPHMSLDTPAVSYTGDIPVVGWAVSHYGLSRVDVYVDGRGYSSLPASSFSARSDIAALFGGKNYGGLDKTGFAGTVAGKDLAGGRHTVRVGMIDSQGNVLWSGTKTITVVAPANRLSLDLAAGSYTGNIPVTGWAASHFGVKSVDVYVDGHGVCSLPASGFSDRSDIEALLGGKGYNDLAHSGFSATLQSQGLSVGTHTVRVAEIDNRGNILWSPTKSFTVASLPDQVRLDVPSGSYQDDSDIPVAGWAASHYGAAHVDIYIDGVGFASLQPSGFIERKDVEAAYAGKGYNDLAHSGFSCVISQGRLAAGTHTVRAALVSNSGGILWSAPRTFTIG